MKQNLLKFCFFLLLSLTIATNSNAKNSSSNPDIIYFNSQKSIVLLTSSNFKGDFFNLINYFQPQINPIYCSAASAVIILNALNFNNIPNHPSKQILKPLAMGGGIIKYNLYNQEDFFNAQTNKIKDINVINLKIPQKIIKNKPHYDPGLTLDEFSKILSKIYNLKVEKKHASKYSNKNIEQFRNDLVNILNNKNKFILANFNGKKLNLSSYGHISPIIAYNKESDKILIMDVALHKNLWYWVNVKKFYQAMNTKDHKNYRGYLIISKKDVH